MASQKPTWSPKEVAARLLYFIRDTGNGAIKIGVANNPSQRLHDLQVANPSRLQLLGVIPGDRRCERALHRHFAPYRLRGEWFRGKPALVDEVYSLLSRPTAFKPWGVMPWTVQDELERRSECRYGLRGVLVSLPRCREGPLLVDSSGWDRLGQLVLTLVREADVHRLPRLERGFYTGDEILAHCDRVRESRLLRDAPARDCRLLSDWPAPCPCWFSFREDQG